MTAKQNNWEQERLEKATASDLRYAAWLHTWRGAPLWRALQAALESFTAPDPMGTPRWKRLAASISRDVPAILTTKPAGSTYYDCWPQ